MAAHGLTENHERGLLASVQYASKLIRDCEEILAASDRPSPLNRYTGGLTPPQRKIVEDYLHRLQQQLLRFLDAAGISPPPARISAVHALANAMMFVDNALEEMRGGYLRGYGEISPEAERLLDGAVSEMQAQVRDIESFLTGASADVLGTRLDSLPEGDPIADDLNTLERIITTYGLVEEDLSLLAFLHEAGITTSVLLSKADLLASEDLQRVQPYIAGEIQKRLGAVIGVRPVSVRPSHADLLHAWIANDVVPLGSEAVARRQEALRRKLEVLRSQTAAMLDLRTARGERRTVDTTKAVAIASRLRDVSAALERHNRDLSALSDRRQSIVDAALASAVSTFVERVGNDESLSEAVRAELARPAHDEAGRVARELERLADDVRSALADAASAAGFAGPPDTMVGHREVPLVTLPSFSPPGAPPVWTRVSASLARKWFGDTLHEQWAPALDRAVAAYLDVLKHWAADGFAQLREAFESGSRPLLAQLDVAPAPPDRDGPVPVESDLRWLRQAKEPNTSRDGVPASSFQE